MGSIGSNIKFHRSDICPVCNKNNLVQLKYTVIVHLSQIGQDLVDWNVILDKHFSYLDPLYCEFS